MTAKSIHPVLLYAEDDKIIQLNMVELLEAAGFDLLIVDDGAAALKVLATEPGVIDGLVIDVNLGKGPSGWLVARSARERSPTMSIVYTSSVTEAEWMTDGVPLSKLLAKPFRPSRVIDSMWSLLTVTAARVRTILGSPVEDRGIDLPVAELDSGAMTPDLSPSTLLLTRLIPQIAATIIRPDIAARTRQRPACARPGLL